MERNHNELEGGCVVLSSAFRLQQMCVLIEKNYAIPPMPAGGRGASPLHERDEKKHPHLKIGQGFFILWITSFRFLAFILKVNQRLVFICFFYLTAMDLLFVCFWLVKSAYE